MPGPRYAHSLRLSPQPRLRQRLKRFILPAGAFLFVLAGATAAPAMQAAASTTTTVAYQATDSGYPHKYLTSNASGSVTFGVGGPYDGPYYSQIWYKTAVASGRYQLRNAAYGGLCLDATTTYAVARACNLGLLSQRWAVGKDSQGRAGLINGQTGFRIQSNGTGSSHQWFLEMPETVP